MRKILVLFLMSAALIQAGASFSQESAEISTHTKVVLLGTGNPHPDPDRSGCSVAVVVNDSAYFVDFGPGIVRRAAALTPEFGGGIEALRAKNIKRGFLTHLHSDHTAGYPDFILTPWVMGRDEPLEVFGPEGTKEMTDSILKAYQEDIRYRLYGLEPANNQGWRVVVHEIKEGLIYQDQYVKVEAFSVAHGSWPHAYGYRFTSPDKVIVISGDTAPCDNIIKYGKGADMLIHEVYYKKGFDTKDEVWKKYHAAHHTSTYELGEIARQTKPGLLILYHLLLWGATEEDLLQEIAEKYDGKVVVGSDLDVFE